MYRLEYLPSAETDILDIDAYLYEHSPVAADKFAENLDRVAETLLLYPLISPIYEADSYFRHMTLPYKYRLFYHVDEEQEVIKVYRVLHGMRDVKAILKPQG